MPELREILSDRDLYFVEPNHTVAEAAHRMAGLHVGAILVLGDGRLRGLFSERDLMTRVVVLNRDVQTTRVADVMTTDVATIDANATIEDAMEMMHRIGCRHLPVIGEDRVVGMVSMRDLMYVELKRKTEEIEHMRAYIHGSS